MHRTTCLLHTLIATWALLAPTLRSEPAPPPRTFLFIGNSFTYRHELKDIFGELASQGHPGQSFITERITYGGRDMFRHFELYRSQDLLRIGTISDAELGHSVSALDALAASTNPPDVYTQYWRKIDPAAAKPWEDYEAALAAGHPVAQPSAPSPAQWEVDRGVIRIAATHHREWLARRHAFPSHWDFVVLQSWQDVRSDPDAGYAKYARKFADLATHLGTTPILYITAPYSQNAKPITAPMETSRSSMELHVAAELARKTGARVVPVPLAVQLLQKSGTDLTLRYLKDGHPNQCCAYLTACLFYAAIFDRSPEGLPLSQVRDSKPLDDQHPDLDPDGKPITRIFTEAERTLMQRIAWQAMQAFRKGEF